MAQKNFFIDNDFIKKVLSNRLFHPDHYLDRQISSAKSLLAHQKENIIFLVVVLVVYGIFGKFVPDFNLAQLWIRTDNIFASVMKYWYLFAWGLFLSCITLSSVKIGSFTKAKTLLGLDFLTSLLAGFWEEIAFRGLFIFIAMIVFMLVNFALKWVILAVLIILALWGVISLFSNKLWVFALILGTLAYCLISWWYGFVLVQNPLYWFYQHVIFPILSFVSFGLLDSIIYHKDFSLLFIIAAMTCNLEFRNGHKYQGPFGYINSWIIGYILLHAMMYHGLLVAIIIHAVYDILIGLVHFSKRLIFAKKTPGFHVFVYQLPDYFRKFFLNYFLIIRFPNLGIKMNQYHRNIGNQSGIPSKEALSRCCVLKSNPPKASKTNPISNPIKNSFRSPW